MWEHFPGLFTWLYNHLNCWTWVMNLGGRKHFLICNWSCLLFSFSYSLYFSTSTLAFPHHLLWSSVLHLFTADIRSLGSLLAIPRWKAVVWNHSVTPRPQETRGGMCLHRDSQTSSQFTIYCKGKHFLSYLEEECTWFYAFGRVVHSSEARNQSIYLPLHHRNCCQGCHSSASFW